MNIMRKIQTSRLCLRPLQHGDASRIAELANNPKLAWNLARVPSPYGVADAQAWIAQSIRDWTDGREFAFVIEAPQQGVVGSAGLHPVLDDIWEIGYWVGESYWGRGYASEAGQALLDWAEANLDAEGFVAGHFEDNPASGRVLRRLGFVSVGVVDYPGLARGGLFPARRYARNADPAIALAPSARHVLQH